MPLWNDGLVASCLILSVFTYINYIFSCIPYLYDIVTTLEGGKGIYLNGDRLFPYINSKQV